MGQYNRLPHLLTQPVTNPKKAANALGWAVKEMERRYDLLFEVGFRDISGYNAAFDRGELAAEPAAERLDASDRAVRAAAVHRRRRRRAQRPDDGRRPRRRGVDHPHRPEGPRRRHPPDRRHAAPERQRHHRRHQGQHPGPHGVRRVAASPTAGSSSTSRAPRSSSARATCCCCRATPTSPSASRARSSARRRCARSSPTGAARRPRSPTSAGSRATTADGDDHVTSSANAVSAGGDDDDEAHDAPGDGAGRAQPARLDVDAAAQAQGRLRPGRADHGPARAARRRRPERGLQGPRRADDRRGVRAAASRPSRPVGGLPGSLVRRAAALLRRDAGLPEEPGRLATSWSARCSPTAWPPTDDAGGRRPGRRQHVRLHRRRPPGVDRHRPGPRRAPRATAPASWSPAAWPSATATSWPRRCPRSTRSPGSASSCIAPPDRPPRR